jgi:hypothetical protein
MLGHRLFPRDMAIPAATPTVAESYPKSGLKADFSRRPDELYGLFHDDEMVRFNPSRYISA